jgi:hypothetical protein
MASGFSRGSAAARLAAALGLAIVLARGYGSADAADSTHARGLAGTWRVTVTSHDCDTGDPLASFPAMLTFASGGTLTGTTAAPIFKPGQRSSDHGIWRPRGGSQYRAVSEAFILFDSLPPPIPLARGVQRITQQIEMDGDDRFDSDAYVEFFDVNGDVVLTLCATAAASRFE